MTEPTQSNDLDYVRQVVWRTVLPTRDVADVLPLYVDLPSSGGFDILDRRSLVMSTRGTVSFCSYFNAFPAAYWQARAAITEVRLTVRARSVENGSCGADGALIRVYRSDGAGRIRLAVEEALEGRAAVQIDVPVSGFEAGGYYWFDLVAGENGAVLEAADWSILTRRGSGTATIGMATYNRPAECLAQLVALAGEPEVLRIVDRIVVVDQGTDEVSGQEGFVRMAAELGDRLVLIRQPNLGGSGGFSRAMAETLERGESRYMILLDDDAISEPESIMRAVRFADAAESALIVGGGMLHLDARSVLYTQSEQWNERIGWVDLARPGAYDHDFARDPLRTTPNLHRVHRADFNGWWMCLIPVALLRERGLSLPLFLKGDDMEFGRRAAEHGVETVSLPGVAVWHLGWGGKAPTRTWEAYFLHRNRLIGELLHSSRRRPGRVILHSLLGDLKLLLTLQYSAVRLRGQAIEDIFTGPDHLHGWLVTRASQIRELWSMYPDTTPVSFPPETVEPLRPITPPASRRARVVLLLRLWRRHLFVPVSRASRVAPEVRVTAAELSWTTFAGNDSALVETADGLTHVWYRRSRIETSRALRKSIVDHVRLWVAWPRLAARLRDSATGLASPEAWRHTFGHDT